MIVTESGFEPVYTAEESVEQESSEPQNEVAGAIGRSPDERLIIDFHAEVLGNHEDITAKGPIETAAYDKPAATAPPVEPVAPPPSTTQDSEE